MRTFKHIKTVPLMDELEGIIILNEVHTRDILNLKAPSVKTTSVPLSDHILVTAGNKGIIRILRVTMKVRNLVSIEIYQISTPFIFVSSKYIS